MATLPPILVELKANSSELTSKLGEIQGQFQKTSSEAQTMGDKIKAHFGAISTAVGGAIAGAGGALAALGSKDQAAQQQLQASIEATGKSYDDYKDRVEKTVTANEKFGATADQSKDAIRILTQATGDAGSAMDQMQLVTNLAAAKHESLSAAATQVAKAHGGAAKIFKEFGVQVGTNEAGAKDYDQALAVLSNKLSGQATAASDTFAGKIAGIKAHVEDVAAAFGSRFGPALTVAGTAMTGLASGMSLASGVIDHFKTTQETATVATEGLTAAEDAEVISEGLALGPILLIVGAVAAVGVAIYELATHWSTVWDAVKTAIGDAWNWIRDRINDIVGFVTGIPGRIAGVAVTMWDGIKTAFTAVKNWISDRIDDMIGFFTGLPGRIAHAAAGMWDGIKEAFKAAINGLIDVWNALHFTIGGWKVGVGPVSVTLPKVDVGLPTIPHLAAGGLVMSEGLAFLHAAEVVSPAPAFATAGRGGDNITQNIYPAPGMDVNALANLVRDKLIQAKRRNVNGALA